MVQGQPYGAPMFQGQVMGAPPARRTVPPVQPAFQPNLPPTLAQSAETPRREVRGVAAEEREPRSIQAAVQPPTPVVIPSPEQLGVAAPPVVPRDPNLDWVGIRKQLRDLGAVRFQLEQTTDGGTRFICELATAEFGRTQGIEAQARTEAEAVRLVLARAEQWKRRN